MNRRRFFIQVLVGLAAAIAAAFGLRRRKGRSMTPESPFDRVVFVCCDEHGEYSPGVYLHGAVGGGPACLSLAAEAASGMRTGDVGDSAAGLCGYLFTRLGPEATGGGGLSLWDAPKTGPSGAVDWQAYCSWNVDLILVDVDRRSAECYVSPADAEAPSKSFVGRIDDLEFGG